jgi:diguanylate cyclase (GGDEF)-like protein
MDRAERNGNGKAPLPLSGAQARDVLAGDQSAADADQTTADADQTAQDTDQTGADRDDAAADNDQTASNRDQGAADRDQASDRSPTDAEAAAYQQSRSDREAGKQARAQSHQDREATGTARIVSASERDAMAAARDDSARRRDARAAAIDGTIAESKAPIAEQLQLLRAQASADRERAAADRARAAADRVAAALERARLEDGLRTAHLDDLTGAYRRGMGRLAIANEIERARRGDGRFVMAFVDVDDMKGVNDRDGHAAGDLVLQALVRIIRSNLRPFDPVIRYGGDEFLCGLGGVDLADAEARFRDIDIALRREVAVGITCGLASLEPGETPDQLTARADQALLTAKGNASRAG